MSLVICLRNSGSIVLASDSGELMLGPTAEITIAKPKIEILAAETWIGAASNDARFADWVISYFKECYEVTKGTTFPNGMDKRDIYGITGGFANILKDHQEKFISEWQKTKETPMEMYTEFIICGFTIGGIPKINELSNFDPACPPFIPKEVRGDYCLAGHKPVVQHYISRIDRLSPIGKMDTPSLIRLIVFLINETMKANIEIQLPIHAVILKYNAPVVEISQDEIETIRTRMDKIVDDKKILSVITKSD